MFITQKPVQGQIVNWNEYVGDKPVGEWWLNEPSGLMAYDSSGNNNHGTFTNGAEKILTPWGVGANFPGTDDVISVPGTSPALKIGGFGITCAVLHKMPAVAVNSISMSKTISAWIYQMGVSGTGQYFTFQITNTNTALGPGGAGGLNPYLGKWVWQFGRFNGQSVMVSVWAPGVGFKTWTTARTTAIPTNNDTFSIGNRSGQTTASSQVDRAFIWDKCLSDEQLQKLMFAPIPIFDGYEYSTGEASDITVSPQALSLSLTQPAPTTKYDVKYSANALSLALNRYDPTIGVEYNVTVSPQALGLSLAQPTPSTKYDIAVSPSALSLSLAQKAPTIKFDMTVVPDALGLTLNLSDISVEGDGNITFNAPALPLSLTLNDPELSFDMKVGVAALSVIAALKDPTITTGATPNGTYIIKQNNRLELYVNNTEVARFNPDGSIDIHGTLNENAF